MHLGPGGRLCWEHFPLPSSSGLQLLPLGPGAALSLGSWTHWCLFLQDQRSVPARALIPLREPAVRRAFALPPAPSSPVLGSLPRTLCSLQLPFLVPSPLDFPLFSSSSIPWFLSLPPLLRLYCHWESEYQVTIFGGKRGFS